MIDKKELEI